MKKLILILMFCLCGQALGATYYVKVDGSDEAAGTSWGTAWATVGQVNTNISEGDSVFFGTGTWYDSQLIPPTGGDTDDWTAYLDSTGDSTTANNTRICGGTLLDGTWVQRGSTNIWAHGKTGLTTQSHCVTQDDSLLYTDESIGDLAARGVFEDVAADSVYVYCYDSGDPNDKTMVTATRDNWPLKIAAGCRAVAFVGINISHGALSCVYVDRGAGTDGPDFLAFDHCWISFSGGDAGENTAVYYPVQGQTSDTTEYSNDVTFTNCILGPSVGDARGYVNNLSNVVTYGHHHMRFTDCYFRGEGIGLYLKDKQESQERKGISAVGCTFKGCTQAAVKWSSHADSDTVAGCYMIGCGNGAWCYGSTTASFNGRIFIVHNTMIDCEDTGIKFSDISTSSGVCFGVDNVFKYNIIAACSSGLFIGVEDYDGLCTDFWDEITWDGNLYYNPEASYDFSTDLLDCGAGSDWDHWHTTCGIDPNGSNSIDPDLNEDNSRGTYDILSDSIYVWPYWFVTEGAWTPRGYSLNTRHRNILRGGVIQGGKIE